MDIKKPSPTDNEGRDLQVGRVTEYDEGKRFLIRNDYTPNAVQALLDDVPRNRALVRKVDLMILPLLAGTYTLQYMLSVVSYSESLKHLSRHASCWSLACAGIAYSCNGLGAVVGGVLTYGIGQIRTIAVWRAIYLILWWDHHRVGSYRASLPAGRYRLRKKIQARREGPFDRSQSTGSHGLWILFFVLFDGVVNGGVSNFSKLTIKGLTKNPLMTVALGIPFGGFQIAWVLSGTFLAS
ncbi:MFS transporter [Penicillium capsulatum]|uniref:MFS transporter n=1 Tax=Penicillium capsulatum TaxID=69766 RepID=A0A9W9LL82_9EURO|nr:MFS transporter [Penicillium capsulatum]